MPFLHRAFPSWAWLAFSLAGYWLILIRHLQVEWALNPQYAYGYAVPFLCVCLVWRRLPHADSPSAGPFHTARFPGFSSSVILTASLVGCLLVYGLARCAEGANPDWRLVSWALSLSVAGTTLAIVGLTAGQGTLAQLALPLCFFLVAVPWLRPIEALVVRNLAAGNAALSVELLNLVGIGALRHGNVIEVATGLVGIDDACSGIRSFQASLMVAGFFGLFYRLRWSHLLALLGVGPVLAFLLNVLRTFILCVVADRRGIHAIDAWHDSLGTVILLACFACLWLLARRSASPLPLLCNPDSQSAESQDCILQSAQASKDSPQESGDEPQASGATGGQPSTIYQPPSTSPPPATLLLSTTLTWAPITLLCWFLAVEVATECWYRAREQDRLPTPSWTVEWSTDMPGFASVPISPSVHAQLRFNEGKSACWHDNTGLQWQLFYFRWLAGRSWTQLVGDHNPSVCLPASGRRLVNAVNLDPMLINGIPLLVRSYTFLEENRTLYVFYAVWEDGTPQQHYLRESVTAKDRFDAFLQGRRNHGMRVIEAALSGATDLSHATAAFQTQLARLLKPLPAP